jgi:hypothetical protein
MTFHERQPPMEDDLPWKTTSIGRRPQIFKLEYFSNHWSDLPNILNLSLVDQTIWATTDLIQILNLSLGNKTKIEMKTASNVRQPDNIKSVSYNLTLIRSCLNFKLELKMKKASPFKYSWKPWLIFNTGNPEDILKEISSVALHSPAFFTL